VRKKFPHEYVLARDLKMLDWVGVPKRVGLPPSALSDEQLYAVGYWLAEGHIQFDWSQTQPRGLGLSSTEAHYLDRVGPVFERWFPHDRVKRGNQFVGWRWHDQPARTWRHVGPPRGRSKPLESWQLHSRPAAEYFMQHFGCHSDGKFIGPAIYDRSGLLPLVTGFLDGDGAQRRGQQQDVTLYTVSARLAEQLRQILLDSGVWCTMRCMQLKPYANQVNGKRIPLAKPIWLITIKMTYLHLLPPCKVTVPDTVKVNYHVMEDATHFYTPVRSIVVVPTNEGGG
jgi:hypothetical protein